MPRSSHLFHQVVLAASICTRGGKAIVSRQFREMQRSRIEALLASFPKLADSGTQHTIAEQDNVRYVYQPLDELYMVLITNLQSNILQDINSLHLFAQVVSSICKSLDEREILKNAFELLSAFDEIVTMGYRENLTLSQIKTFLDMESHEERIQEIIARNKELEASEERKRRAKQLEMQRKEMSRSSRAAGGGGMGGGSGPRTPQYPTYTPSAPATVPDTYDSYEAEKKKASKPLALGKKGMQLGKKNKSTNMYDQVAGDMPAEAEPLVSSPKTAAPVAPASARQSTSFDREAVHITTSESISARLDREGLLKSFEVKGELQLKITDPAFTQVKLELHAGQTHGAQLITHPKVDKAAFKNSKTIQLTDTSKGFPSNMGIGVMKWKLAPKVEDVSDPPITFRVWVEENGNMFNITVEYELTGGDTLKDVTVTIPYETDEPNVSSFDAVYEVSGDSLEWNIGTVDEEHSSGSFEFEAQADSEADFFPMRVRFNKSNPFVDVSVSGSLYALCMSTGINNTTGRFGFSALYEPGHQLFKGHQVQCGRLRDCLSDVHRRCTKLRCSMFNGDSAELGASIDSNDARIDDINDQTPNCLFVPSRGSGCGCGSGRMSNFQFRLPLCSVFFCSSSLFLIRSPFSVPTSSTASRITQTRIAERLPLLSMAKDWALEQAFLAKTM